ARRRRRRNRLALSAIRRTRGAFPAISADENESQVCSCAREKYFLAGTRKTFGSGSASGYGTRRITRRARGTRAARSHRVKDFSRAPGALWDAALVGGDDIEVWPNRWAVP